MGLGAGNGASEEQTYWKWLCRALVGKMQVPCV